MKKLAWRAGVVAGLLMIVSSTASSRARAQPPPDAPPPPPSPTADAPPPEPPQPLTAAARADAMFQKGKRLLEDGQVDAACKELAASDALDPTVGTLGLLAACHEQQGRIATAWGEFRETARRADAAKDERAVFARQRAAALEPRLPKLSIRLARRVISATDPPRGPSARPGVVISKNHEPVPATEIGIDVPVDPGPYEIVARAPGGREHHALVVAQESTSVVVDVPDLAPPALPAPPLDASPARSGDASFPARIGARWPAALVAGGVGLVGLGVGAAAGIAAMNQSLESNQAHDSCAQPGAAPNACAAGRDERNGAFQAATISSVGFGVGAAGLGIGAALLLWPSKGGAPATGRGLAVAPLVGSNGGGAFARGVF